MQHVPVGQDREQHELELRPLADDGPLHLVEHGGRARADLLQGEAAHLARADLLEAIDRRANVGEGDPGAVAVTGRWPVAAHELPRLGPDRMRRDLRIAVEIDPGRREPVACDVAQQRTQALVRVAGAPTRHADLALHRPEALRAGRLLGPALPASLDPWDGRQERDGDDRSGREQDGTRGRHPASSPAMVSTASTASACIPRSIGWVLKRARA